jgi:hypothetical protein
MPRKKKITEAEAPAEAPSDKTIRKKSPVKVSLPLPDGILGDLVTFITWEDLVRIMTSSPAAVNSYTHLPGVAWFESDDRNSFRFLAYNEFDNEDFTFDRSKVKSIKLWRFKQNRGACFVSFEFEDEIYVFYPLVPPKVHEACGVATLPFEPI